MQCINIRTAAVKDRNLTILFLYSVICIFFLQGTGQPKAGHIGNSEAKVCADAILRNINGVALYSAPKTNSACYSPTSKNEASWLSAVYKYDPSTQSMTLAHKGSGPSTMKHYRDMFMWSENLFADTFT